MSENLFIAYCSENQSIAQQIAKKLDASNFEFTLLNEQQMGQHQSMSLAISASEQNGLVLISDNFLKSDACMDGMLAYVQNSPNLKSTQFVIVDGRAQSSNGQYIAVETSFERVSNVIKYMNFWQEQYLDMRKQKREVPANQAESFDQKVQVVKGISAEIGDFLRILRTTDHWSFDQLCANNFELLFKKFGAVGAYQAYQKKVVNQVQEPALVSQQASSIEMEVETVAMTEVPEMPVENISPADQTIVLPIVEESIDIPKNEDKKDPIDEEVNLSPLPVNPILQKVIDSKLDPASNLPTEPEPPIEPEETPIEPPIVETPIEETPMAETPDMEEEEEEETEPVVGNQPLSDSYEALQDVFGEETETEEEIIEEDIEEINFELPPSVPVEDIEINQLITDEDSLDQAESDEAESDEDDNMEIEEESSSDDGFQMVDLAQMVDEANDLIEGGNIREGVARYETLLTQHPENTHLRFNYAIILVNEIGDNDLATTQLEKIVDIDPTHARAYRLLAEIAEQQHDYLNAKDYYEKVILLNPEAKGIYYKLGLITAGFYSNKSKLAAKYFKRSILQDKNNGDAHYHLALLYHDQLQKPDKAMKHFRKTMKINPNHPFANYDLAILYHKMGNAKSAAFYYQRAWQINDEVKTSENDIVFHYEEPKEVIDPVETPVALAAVEPKVETPKEPGKIVLITGATSGIGRATAAKFAQNGYRLILTGRRAERLAELEQAFKTTHQSTIQTLSFDVRDVEAVKTAIASLDDEWRQVDILINNAGLAKGFHAIHEGDIEHWDTMIDTNVKGLLYLTRAIAPHMVDRRSGHIINVCSTAGKEVYPKGNVYCATKHAVDALTQAMRVDLHPYNIRVGQVSPGHVEETEFAYVRFEDQEKAKIYEDFNPLKSSDVADVIYFMATCPPHVNIQDVLMMGTQQANSNFINRSGRMNEDPS